MITREEAKEIARSYIEKDPEVLSEIAEIESMIRQAAREGELSVCLKNKGTKAFYSAKDAIYRSGGISFSGISTDAVHWAKWN